MSHLLETVLLGIIEGITEFLPISSTAHLLITEQLLGSQRSDAFNIIIQSGAILAVVFIYWKRLLNLALNFNQPAQRDYLQKLLVSFLITGAGGFAAKKLGFKLPETLGPIILAMSGGAFLILLAEYFASKQKGVDPASDAPISWPVAILVGLAQILAAVCPGLSRSGACIIAAMLTGQGRASATEFSFLVGIPTMFAASLFSAHHAYKAGEFTATAGADLALGFVVSMITAFIAVKWLLNYIRSHTFVPFAWYRIVLSTGLLAFLLMQKAQ